MEQEAIAVGKWKIQHFSFRHYEQAIALWKLSGLTIYPNDSKKGIEQLLKHQGTFLVCMAGEKLIGTLMAGFDGRRAWLYHLAVHPDYQRHGIGSELVSAMEKLLYANGAHHIRAHIDKSNAASQAFFAKAGYALKDCYLLASKNKN